MQRVEVRIAGRLDPSWSEWLNDFSITHTDQEETILTGVVPDQAALYGLIGKIRDLGLKLISVNFGEYAPD